MPKDAKKNVDRYKIRGGDLNEFEFSQNQARLKEFFPGTEKSAMPMKGPTAEGALPKTTTAKESVQKKTARKSATKTTAKKSAKTAKKSTKKTTAKKPAKKSAKKTTAKKSAKK